MKTATTTMTTVDAGKTTAHARLLLRVHSAKGLHPAASSLGVYAKLYVGDTPMMNGSEKTLFSKRTHHASEDNAHGGGGEAESGAHRVFRTKTVAPSAEAEGKASGALWDENFDVLLHDAPTDILSVRVKSKHRLYPAVLGVCAIQLKQLTVGRMVDKWVPLAKGSREVASLRLQLLLAPPLDAHKHPDRTQAVLQADIKTALAANQSADEAIERLLAAAATNKKKETRTAHHDPREEEQLRMKKEACAASAELVPAAFSA